jgi:hypothetical protein
MIEQLAKHIPALAVFTKVLKLKQRLLFPDIIQHHHCPNSGKHNHMRYSFEKGKKAKAKGKSPS